MNQIPSRPLPVRVVKVGGSLLRWRPLATRLHDWLGRQPAAHTLLLAGGGELADAIRRADAAHSLGESAAHWLCIDALSVTARLLATILKLPVPACCDESLELQLAPAAPLTLVIDAASFLRERESRLPGCVLPHDWSATSDSIAVRLAQAMHAQEVVLLKSADVPAAHAPSDLALAGYVDAFFPTAIRHWSGSLRIFNLRGENPAQPGS